MDVPGSPPQQTSLRLEMQAADVPTAAPPSIGPSPGRASACSVIRVKTDATNNIRRATTPLELNEAGADVLPGHLGIEVTHWAAGEVRGRLPLQRALFAPHGFVHGGTLVAFADSLCGYGCVTCLPEGAQGFTTVELKANLVGAARTGDLLGTAMRVHGGRATQVWDAKVTDETGSSVALFRCTQLLLWPRLTRPDCAPPAHRDACIAV